MAAEVWYVIEIVGFVLAGLLFVLSVVLFFRLHVPALVSELSGKKYKKEIKRINERRISNRGNPLNRMDESRDKQKVEESTSILSYDKTETMVLSNKTSVLQSSGATTVLRSDQQFQVVREIIEIHTDERII